MATNKSILITGCSSGIGLAAATTLKQRGYRVFATARKETDVQKLISKGFESLRLDINENASIQQAVNQILSLTGGTLDALFNNAGFAQPGAVEDLNRNLDRAQFETNVFGPMALIRLLIPIMRRQGHGRIVQNSSILGVVSVPYTGAYNASKHALEGYTASLRQELRGTNIHVSCLNPGPTESKMRVNAFQAFMSELENFKNSAHADAYRKMEKTYFQQQQKGISTQPKAVIKKLIHALESKHPRAHYFIGPTARISAILHRFLPDFALDWIMAKSR